MSVILIDSFFKSSETTFCTFSPEEFEKMKSNGLITKKNRIYQLILNYHQFQVICPVKMENGVAVGVYLPAFKSPYRPYPCYVYLFSVVLHLSGLSMRKAAKETGKKFGISTYSHSTISRVLKVLLAKFEELVAVRKQEDQKSNEAQEPNSQQNQLSYPGKPSGINFNVDKKLSTENKKELYEILLPLLENPNLGVQLVYQYFLKYGTLLI